MTPCVACLPHVHCVSAPSVSLRRWNTLTCRATLLQQRRGDPGGTDCAPSPKCHCKLAAHVGQAEAFELLGGTARGSGSPES